VRKQPCDEGRGFAVKNFREVTVVALKQAGSPPGRGRVAGHHVLGPRPGRSVRDKDVLPREMFVKSLYDRNPNSDSGRANGGRTVDGPAAVEVDKRIASSSRRATRKTTARARNSSRPASRNCGSGTFVDRGKT